MKARSSILSMTIVALFAAGGAAFAYGPGPQAGMGPRSAAPLDPAHQAERVRTRLDALKDALKLQPAQLDAWNAYATRVAAEAQTRAQMRESMFDSRGDAQAMGDQHTAMMKHNAQAAEDINGLRKALLATFSAEQKATFDQYAPGPGQWRGMQGRGPGPGFGAGRGGGRGMGYGNCQFAA